MVIYFNAQVRDALGIVSSLSTPQVSDTGIPRDKALVLRKISPFSL